MAFVEMDFASSGGSEYNALTNGGYELMPYVDGGDGNRYIKFNLKKKPTNITIVVKATPTLYTAFLYSSENPSVYQFVRSDATAGSVDKAIVNSISLINSTDRLAICDDGTVGIFSGNNSNIFWVATFD